MGYVFRRRIANIQLSRCILHINMVKRLSLEIGALIFKSKNIPLGSWMGEKHG
jgi:hypothetical protein